MTERSGLSVVIVNWNTRQLLLDVMGELERYRQLHERPLQIVIVDNASEDGSVEALREAHPDCELHVQAENLGFAGGVNVGFAHAREKWILLLNTDVRFEAEALEQLVAFAETRDDAGILGPRVLNDDGSFQSSYWRFPGLWQLLSQALYLYKLFPRSEFFDGQRYGGRIFEEPTPVDAVSGCVFLLRKSLLDEVGGLDEGYFMYFEETDLCRRARSAGSRVLYAPVASFVHFGGVSARLARRRNFLEFRRSRVRWFRKHRGGFAAILARMLNALFLLIRMPGWLLRSLLPGERRREARSRVALHAAGILDAFGLGGK
jgi:N-acetylglucosaminyl-diphospho-decaprenol L-rhamnosyltransferase